MPVYTKSNAGGERNGHRATEWIILVFCLFIVFNVCVKRALYTRLTKVHIKSSIMFATTTLAFHNDIIIVGAIVLINNKEIIFTQVFHSLLQCTQ